MTDRCMRHRWAGLITNPTLWVQDISSDALSCAHSWANYDCFWMWFHNLAACLSNIFFFSFFFSFLVSDKHWEAMEAVSWLQWHYRVHISWGRKEALLGCQEPLHSMSCTLSGGLSRCETSKDPAHGHMHACYGFWTTNGFFFFFFPLKI